MSETPGEYNAIGPGAEPAPAVVAGVDAAREAVKLNREHVRTAWTRAMRRQKLRQCDVAVAVGVASGTVSGWVNGTQCPSVGKLVAAAEFLGTSPADLLGWYGKAGDRLNGDCLRVASTRSSWPYPFGDAGALALVADLAAGLRGGLVAARRDCLERVLVRVAEELGCMEEVYPKLGASPCAFPGEPPRELQAAPPVDQAESAPLAYPEAAAIPDVSFPAQVVAAGVLKAAEAQAAQATTQGPRRRRPPRSWWRRLVG